MRAQSFLDALHHLPVATLKDLTGGRPFVVLSPHPDDESLGVGGLIAAACEAGQRVDVLILTDGAGSHPNSLSHPQGRLIALRKAEAAQAAVDLGLPPERLGHLDLPDTQAPTEGPAFERALDRIIAVIRDAQASTVLVTWNHDPHCDHQAAARMADAVRQRVPGLTIWCYPIWGWHLDPETAIDAPPPRGVRLDIRRWLTAKHAAIAAHTSQMTALIDDDPQGFRFDEASIAPFLGPFEYFVEMPR